MLGKPENLTIEARQRGVEVIKANAQNNDRNRQALSVIGSCMERSMTYREIANHLNELNFKTRYGKQFLPSTVHQLFNKSTKMAA